MKFAKREVRLIEITNLSTNSLIFKKIKLTDRILTVYAYDAKYSGANTFVIEELDKVTGECWSDQIQLASDISSQVLIKEKLLVDTSVVADVVAS